MPGYDIWWEPDVERRIDRAPYKCPHMSHLIHPNGTVVDSCDDRFVEAAAREVLALTLDHYEAQFAAATQETQ